MNITKKVKFLRIIAAAVALASVLPMSVPVEAQSVAPIISSVAPDVGVVAGTTQLVITGTNLTDTVQFFDGSAGRHTVKGTINDANTQVTVIAPSSLPVGNATVKIYLNANTVSNGKLIGISSSQVIIPGDTTSPNPNPTVTNPISTWNPTQTDNGWWPSLHPEGRYVAYGNWGESWVTDLQTKETWNFSVPEGLPEGGRCMGGQWKTADTLLFVCDSIPGLTGFYQYEVKVGEWIARKTNEDPNLVVASNWIAKDGHWASHAAVTHIVKDGTVLNRSKPGGAMSMSENTLVHACTNSNRTICVYEGTKKTKTYTARIPMFGTDVYKGYIAYGGKGPIRGIDPKGKDVELSAVRGMFESEPKIVAVDGKPWIATNVWPNKSGSVVPGVEQFMMIRPWGERASIIVEAAAANFSIIRSGSNFVIAYNNDKGHLTVKTVRINSTRSDVCGSACPESPLPETGAKIIAQKDLGAGTFPDVVFYNDKLWLAMMIDRKLKLYSFNKNLTGQQEIDIPFSGYGQAFPRLMVHKGVLWLAFRDGDNSSNVPESIKLWRGDTNAIEDLGGGFGNDPVALGNGYVAWQQLQADGKTWKVVRRLVEGGNVSVIRNGVATGLSRIMPNGRIITIDEDRTSVPWGLNAWYANPLVVTTDVTPKDDNGVAGRFNNDLKTEFNLWAGQRAHTPHAASDGKGTYAVATWNPTARVAVISGPVTDDGTNPLPSEPAPVCDPWPTDTEEVLACTFYELNNPSPRYYEPATDPANPAPSGVKGTTGLALAYNSQDGTTLVVGGSGDVTAQLQNSQDQSLLGSSTRVDQGGAASSNSPRAVYNSETSQFLITWADSRPTAGTRNIWGRVLNGDGTAMGNDFAIAERVEADASALVHDHALDSYAVAYQRAGISVRLVAQNGTPGVEKNVAPAGAKDPSIALNENANEFWLTYTQTVDGQNKVMLQRLTKSLEKSGEATHLSVAHAPISGSSSIACSASSAGCAVAWGPALGLGGKGIYGRSISDAGVVQDEMELITPLVAQYGKEFNSAVINYNPWTESFFLSAGDNAGGVALCELSLGSDCKYINQVIAPTSYAQGPLQRVLGWFRTAVAQAAPGNVFPSNVSTNFGSSVYAARDGEGIHGVNYATQSVAQADSSTPPTTPTPANPAPSGTGNPCTISGIRPGPDKLSTLPMCINQIYVWSLGLGALLALLMTVMGGYLYMTAAGNAEQSSKAKEYIWGSVIGLALLFTAYILLRTINPDLTNFNTSSLQKLQRERNTPAPTTTAPAPTGSIRGGP